MIELFNPENRFWNFVGKLADVLLLSVLWAACSLPLVTAGAATAALYGVTLHLAEDTEGGILGGFFRGFGRCFGRATLCWLGEVFAGLFLLFDCWLCLRMGDVWYARAALVVLASVSLALLLLQLYLYPLLAAFDLPVKKALVHAFVMAMGNLPVSVTALALFAAAGVGAYFLPMLGFLFFGLAAFLCSYLFLHVFGRYMTDRGGRAAAGPGEGAA